MPNCSKLSALPTLSAPLPLLVAQRCCFVQYSQMTSIPALQPSVLPSIQSQSAASQSTASRSRIWHHRLMLNLLGPLRLDVFPRWPVTRRSQQCMTAFHAATHLVAWQTDASDRKDSQARFPTQQHRRRTATKSPAQRWPPTFTTARTMFQKVRFQKRLSLEYRSSALQARMESTDVPFRNPTGHSSANRLLHVIRLYIYIYISKKACAASGLLRAYLPKSYALCTFRQRSPKRRGRVDGLRNQGLPTAGPLTILGENSTSTITRTRFWEASWWTRRMRHVVFWFVNRDQRGPVMDAISQT